MDLLENKYPIIRNIYYDFQNSEEYNNNPLTAGNCEKAYAMMDKIKNADMDKVEDVILSYSADCELSGFILGFTYALNLIKESEVLKELAQ